CKKQIIQYNFQKMNEKQMSQKINLILNPKFLGFQIDQNDNQIKYDNEIQKDINSLNDLAIKIKEKLKQNIPLKSQLQVNQELQKDFIINLEQLKKQFSFQGVDNLMKNLHLFDPKLAQIKYELQQQLQQKHIINFFNQSQEIKLENNKESNHNINKEKKKKVQLKCITLFRHISEKLEINFFIKIIIQIFLQGWENEIQQLENQSLINIQE
ncbi:hypothetical protein IMG5_098170, partial [Ichthyophthirius multifiliis]